MKVLGIETSCDDTSIAIIEGNIGASAPQILAHESFSQEIILAQWGGVVPEIASRNHLDKLVPLLKTVLMKANTELKDIDLIGVTTFPGLLGPLLTGLNAAKSISLLHRTNIVPINHLYAHLEAIHIDQEVSYPYLGLLVSGGHSLFAIVRDKKSFEVIGSTIDDALGEAFDKGGKLIGLGYPAGRIIDELAKDGDPKMFEFPIGLRSSKDCKLSYSGVKTSLRQFLERNPDFLKEKDQEISQKHKNLAASYQHALIGAIKLKMKYAQIKTKEIMGRELPIVVGGGVACNSYLRKVLNENYKNVKFVTPKFCTDNGAMIANYALRIAEEAISWPQSLELDAHNRFLEKGKK